jgi:hypothetical protein
MAELPPLLRAHTDPPRNHIEHQRLEVVGGWRGYDPVLEGPGRWCMLEAPLGRAIGTVWTSDRGGLGFLPVRLDENAAVVAFTSEFVVNAQRAWADGVPASVAFDWWAGRASQGLAARPVVAGDLTDLAAVRFA